MTSELDGVVGQVAATPSPEKRISAGGPPGNEYDFDVPQPVGARSRFAVLFDGKREYSSTAS